MAYNGHRNEAALNPLQKELTMKIVLGTLLALMFAVTASADSVWTYAGNSVSGASNVPTVNPCGCAIDGTVTLDATGNAISWNFTDGTHTLTQANSSGSISSSLISNGTFFSTWSILLETGDGISLFSGFIGSTFEATDSVVAGNSLFMFEEGNHGVWTEVVATPTPEPATGLLIAVSLAILGLSTVAARKNPSIPPFKKT
jgi:hypothetical protein